MRYQRQYNPVSPLTTFDDDGGKGPLDQEYYDNGISTEARGVIKTSRGQDMRDAPAETENEDYVSGGRLPVLARSGNAQDEHQEEGTRNPEELIGNMSDQELAADAVPGPSRFSLATVSIVVVGFLWFLNSSKR